MDMGWQPLTPMWWVHPGGNTGTSTNSAAVTKAIFFEVVFHFAEKEAWNKASKRTDKHNGLKEGAHIKHLTKYINRLGAKGHGKVAAIAKMIVGNGQCTQEKMFQEGLADTCSSLALYDLLFQHVMRVLLHICHQLVVVLALHPVVIV